jgi:type II secretory pathway predicted ATPase ExeA
MSANLMGLRENPFAAGHDPRLIFEHESRAETVAGFRQALAAGEPFVLLTGESGVGKTSVVTQVLAEEKAWSAIITNPLLTRAELLEEICLRFGVDLPESASKPRLLAELEKHLAEIRREEGAPVLVVDEAHDLSLELLEELRLLSNLEFKGRPLLQIVLVGLPTLEARLAQADLAQLRQRIGTHLRLKPLDAESTWRYLHHRVAEAGGDGSERFPDETCLEIHRLTRGIPRAVNTLAGHALIVASRESERVVIIRHVQSAAADTWLRNVADAPPSAGPSPPAPEAKTPAEKPRAKAAAPPPKPAKPETEPPARPVKTSKQSAKGAPPTPAPTPSAPPASEGPAPAEPRESTEPLPPRSSGEPEVRAWISRFVDPDNPIQIGLRAGTSSQPFLDAQSESQLDDVPADPTASPMPRPRRAPAPSAPRPRARDPHWISLAAGIVLVASAGIVFLPRLAKRPHAPADSAAVTMALPTGSPTASPAQTRRGGAGSTKKGSSGKHATPDSTAAHRWQGLEVATYLDPYRASSESERLSELTGLSARVMEAGDSQGEAYRVVLGSFGSRHKAERAADDLVRRGFIEQARVVPLGPIPGHPE